MFDISDFFFLGLFWWKYFLQNDWFSGNIIWKIDSFFLCLVATLKMSWKTSFDIWYMHKISNISYNSKQLYRKKKKKNFYAWHIYLVNKLPNQSKLVHKHLRKKKMTPQNLHWEMHGEFNQFLEA